VCPSPRVVLLVIANVVAVADVILQQINNVDNKAVVWFCIWFFGFFDL
jgi:hypothetical protein